MAMNNKGWKGLVSYLETLLSLSLSLFLSVRIITALHWLWHKGCYYTRREKPATDSHSIRIGHANFPFNLVRNIMPSMRFGHGESMKPQMLLQGEWPVHQWYDAHSWGGSVSVQRRAKKSR